MDNVVIYVHGQDGSRDEAEHYRPLFKDSDVIGFDYTSVFPWDAVKEFSAFFDSVREKYRSVTLIANSIGAYFAMLSLAGKKIDRAFLISPVVDMEKLITDMMSWAGVTEEELCERGEIRTSFGQILSWKYLMYARVHPITWNVPTLIIYGDCDSLTSYATVSAFAERSGSELAVMENGEHWFHTPEQMAFIDRQITDYSERISNP